VRLAMIAYRTLFEDLLAASAAPNHEAPASIAAV
jgi:hypothetical protein